MTPSSTQRSLTFVSGLPMDARASRSLAGSSCRGVRRFGGGSAAGALVAVYGIGNLLGSAGLMLRPLRRDADPLMSSLAALVAATLILVMHTPTLPTSLIAFLQHSPDRSLPSAWQGSLTRCSLRQHSPREVNTHSSRLVAKSSFG